MNDSDLTLPEDTGLFVISLYGAQGTCAGRDFPVAAWVAFLDRRTHYRPTFNLLATRRPAADGNVQCIPFGGVTDEER